jgi:hypothetical protein
VKRASLADGLIVSLAAIVAALMTTIGLAR